MLKYVSIVEKLIEPLWTIYLTAKGSKESHSRFRVSRS